MNYVPAGFYDSNDSDYEFYNGEKEQRVPIAIERPQIEIFKENLLIHLNNNSVDELQNELDNGSIKGFDIDSEVSHEWNLLFHACFNGLPKIVDFLINVRGADVNKFINNESPLMVSCKSSADSEEVFEVVKLLLKKSINIRSTNRFGETAFMMACNKGHVKTVELLLSKGASIDAIDNHGQNVRNYNL